MKIPLNDLSRRTANSHTVAEAINRVLNSGFWIHGPEHQSFQLELADYLGCNHVVGVANGTDALEIALRAIGCTKRSKVITVANAGGYTSIAANKIGCEVVYCDIDADNLLMDPQYLETLLSKEIKAVVVTHLYGNVAPILEIKSLCDKYGILVIEDCAQAIGGLVNNMRVGSIGDIGTFSFYPTKNLGGVGDGGALATSNLQYAKAINQIRQYGWGAKYEIHIPGGMNSRLDEIQAAVLRIGLKDIDRLNEKRRDIVSKYSEALSESNIKLVTSPAIENVAHLAVLQIPEEMPRKYFCEYMSRLGIQTDIHYPILDCDQNGLYQSNISPDLPISRKFSERIVSIPLFPELTPKEVTYICQALVAIRNEA
jgi:aminotransferase EvaB